MLAIKQSLENWWRNITMSDEERYLRDSTDIVDLEHRIRNLLANTQHRMKGI